MDTYKVTVCRFGRVDVQASSEKGAKLKAAGFSPHQVRWLDESAQVPTLLAVYAEKQNVSNA